MASCIRVGGAAGMWGDWPGATPQLLADGDLDYLVYEYLAEVTLSIMARARARDPEAGFAPPFIDEVLTSHAHTIAARGTKVLTNAGGVNVAACADAARRVIAAAGLDLTVATVTGDDLLARRNEFARVREMFTDARFPERERILSVNAYLGAAGIAAALRAGADIVITGRCVDSALTLAACLHAFDWPEDNWDRLAGGSLAGHLLECGPQATGGNFSDWQEAADDIENIGYPIAEIAANGEFVLTKPAGSGGVVSIGSVAEQMLYEIGDPQAYVLPDVVADFSRVALQADGPDRVRVTGAAGRPATEHYKVSTAWTDGYRTGLLLSFTGQEAEPKARRYAEAALSRTRAAFQDADLADFRQTSIEVLGAEDQYGGFRRASQPREVVLKLAVHHDLAEGCRILIKQVSALALATPPGLALFHGGRPKPSPVVRLFSFLLRKDAVRVAIDCGSRQEEVAVAAGQSWDPAAIERPEPPQPPAGDHSNLTSAPLNRLAWARSGDKGDAANIGVIARRPEYLPWIWAALTEERVTERFAHFLAGGVRRYLLPGSYAVNFVLDRVLDGGGIASLRNDPQGKAYAQILLEADIPVPPALQAQTLNTNSQ